MITALFFALGIFGLEAGVGEIVATAERTVSPVPVPTVVTSDAPIPINAYQWLAPFDPSDRAPYAYDWSALLGNGETVTDIVRLTMSAAGAAVGVEIDTDPARAPIIDTDGLKTQLWFKVTDAMQNNPAFLGQGLSVGVSVLVKTSSEPFKMYERTAVLIVRQQ